MNLHQYALPFSKKEARKMGKILLYSFFCTRFGKYKSNFCSISLNKNILSEHTSLLRQDTNPWYTAEYEYPGSFQNTL